MEKIKIIEAESREKWDKFVKDHEEANFLQSWDFYEFHLMRGKKIVRRIAINDRDEILGCYAGVIETAKRGKHLAIAGGPIMDFANLELVKTVFRDIKEQGRKQGCVFVRIRPQLSRTDENMRILRELGLKLAPMYLSVEFAGILDLKKSEEEILKGASQGFRRKLRKAAKNEIVVEKSQNPAVIKDFYRIQLETAERQKFYAFSEDFLEKQFRAFAKNDEVVMYIAKLGEEILAMNFIVFYGAEASYHYGVSSELGTKYSAAPLLHLEAMRDARKRGISRYNLWGIVEKDETEHRFYGVSEFKRSFGCEELRYTPAHDLVLEPARYLATKVIEGVRKKVRKV